MPLRLRLFESPVCTEDMSKIEAMLTPCGNGDKLKESELESGATFSIEIPARKMCRRLSSADVRKSLFSGKRPADDVFDFDSPSTKRQRDDVIDAVEKLESRELIADGTRSYTLPTIPGKHNDLKSITSDTLADVLQGKYSDSVSKVTIVDCRYPYEFEGGHIRGAVNHYTKDAVNGLLTSQETSEGRHILVFHCEFSSERGPKMYRFLRSQDRELNKDHYPQLHFPEVYLLHGGYKAFFELHKNLCDPDDYKPMLHEDHAADLRHFRVKSKSWTAGEKQVSSRRHRSRISRQSLGF